MLPRGILTKNLFCRLVTFLKFNCFEKANELAYIADIIIERITLLYDTENYEDLKVNILLITKASVKTMLEMGKISGRL
jgi:hypothetical protein